MRAGDLLERCRFPDSDPLALGISGGPDSTAMALLAFAAGRDFVVYHVDHGLRPESGRESAVVRSLAEGFDVPFELRTLNLEHGPGLEARAREARYAALPTNICVGHTADDRAETVLFNILRGAGPAGSAARMNRVYRPLINLRRSETRELCTASGVQTVADPFNADTGFTRVAIRRRLMPMIEEIFDRDPVVVLNRHARLIGDALDVVVDAARAIDPTDAAVVAAVPVAVASEAMRMWLRAELNSDSNVDAASIERVLEVAGGRRVAAQIQGGHRVMRTAGRLRVETQRVNG